MSLYPYQILQEQYRFADLIRDKLNNCTRESKINHKEYNLRKIVCNANLLDNVLNNIDNIKLDFIKKQELDFKDRYLIRRDNEFNNGYYEDVEEDENDDEDYESNTIIRPIPTKITPVYEDFTDFYETEAEEEEEEEENYYTEQGSSKFNNGSASNYTYERNGDSNEYLEVNQDMSSQHGVDGTDEDTIQNVPRQTPMDVSPINTLMSTDKQSSLQKTHKQQCIVAQHTV